MNTTQLNSFKPYRKAFGIEPDKTGFHIAIRKQFSLFSEDEKKALRKADKLINTKYKRAQILGMKNMLPRIEKIKAIEDKAKELKQEMAQ